jgi:hypothetical protein
MKTRALEDQPASCSKGITALITRLKQQDCAADHSLLSTTEINNEWSYTSTQPHKPSWCADGNLYLYLNLHRLAAHRLVTILTKLSRLYNIENIQTSFHVGLTFGGKILPPLL